MFRRFSQCRLSSRRLFSGKSNSSEISAFWKWTSKERPSWKKDPKEAVAAIIIFGVTGSGTVALIRPTINSLLGIEGSLIEGPNSYRVFSLLVISPLYAISLFFIATLAGRHRAFAPMSKKILSRFLPSSLKQKIRCPHFPTTISP